MLNVVFSIFHFNNSFVKDTTLVKKKLPNIEAETPISRFFESQLQLAYELVSIVHKDLSAITRTLRGQDAIKSNILPIIDSLMKNMVSRVVC